MPATTASASAKLILLGEHAVVYGHPAIAIPFSDMRLRVSIEPAILAKAGTLRVISPDMDMNLLFDEMSPPDEPIRQMISLLLDFWASKPCPPALCASDPISPPGRGIWLQRGTVGGHHARPFGILGTSPWTKRTW